MRVKLQDFHVLFTFCTVNFVGYDRLLPMCPPDAQAWEELQRVYGLALGALPPALGGPIPGVFQQADLMHRERERLGNVNVCVS